MPKNTPSSTYPPDQVYQQMIVAEQVSRAAPRGQKQRGACSHAHLPTPVVVRLLTSKTVVEIDDPQLVKTLNLQTSRKSKGSDLTCPSGRSCVLTGCAGCRWLQTVLICHSSLRGVTVIKDKVKSFHLFTPLLTSSERYINKPDIVVLISQLRWDAVVKTKKQSALEH